MKNLTGRWILVVLAVTVLVGCGDARKREAGKNLRDATDQARRLYNQALKIMSNPTLGEATQQQTDANDAKAIQLLDQARGIVSKALSADYDALKSNPDQTPTGDAGLAKMMLGLIERLKAQCYTWDYDRTVLKTDVAIGTLFQNLDKAQVQSILLSISETYTTLSDEAVSKAIQETKKTKADLDTSVEALSKKIKDAETKIAGNKKTIGTLSSQAVALRTQQTLTRGKESSKKLEEALKIEAKINDLSNAIQTIEAEMVPVRATLTAEEIKQLEARTKITALEEIQTQRRTKTQDIAKTLDERKEQFTESCKAVIESLAEVDVLAGRAVDKATKAQASLARANAALGDAVKLLDSDKKSAALSEQATAVASQAALQRAMLTHSASLKGVSDHLQSVWDAMHSTKPDQPTAGSVQAFLDASSHAQETALTSYAEAVELLKQAVGAAPREDHWQYKRQLIVQSLDYATLLDCAGHAAEATKLREDARNDFADVEAAAKQAGKDRSILSLKKYVIEETGS